MSELPNNNLEQQESKELTENQKLEQAYGGLDGFQEFMETSLPNFSEELQSELKQVMLANAQNESFVEKLDFFAG